MEESKVLEMINMNPIVIKNIDNPTEEMKLAALKKDGLLLRYINNPTDEMNKIALENNIRAIEYIENPTEDMVLKAIAKGKPEYIVYEGQKAIKVADKIYAI